MTETIQYHPLSDREREVLIWLLQHGPEDATNFLPQIDVVEARSTCSCGCPSIEFNVPLDSPFVHSPQGMRIHATGNSGADEVGVILTAANGVLSELEVFTWGGVDHAFGLPLVETLRASH